jgi:REP element-mobilizing transposase RayT
MVGRYVIMPNHLHFFCAPSDESVVLTRWAQYWKALASRSWPRRNERPIWQRDLWDTRLRHGDSYEAKWEYVRSNPVRHGLVTTADQWPYQGELTALWWDD